MRAFILIAAAGCSATIAPLGAQVGVGPGDSLLQRIQALDTTLAARFRTLDSIRRSVPRPMPEAVIRVGPVGVRTTRQLEPRVRRAAESVAALVVASGDSAVAARVAAHTAVVIPDSARTLFGVSPIIWLRADTGHTWSTAQSRAPVTATSPQLAARLVMFAEQLALQAADSGLSAWVMAGRVPLRQPTDDELAEVFIELATVGSVAARRCQGGDVASCLDVLGIDSMPGSRLDRWYAETDYRGMLLHVAPPAQDSAAAAAWIRCRRRNDQAACVTAAQAVAPHRLPLPLSAAARFTFLRTVLDAGGPGAYDRLLASPGTLDARLAHAAGQPLDVVTRRWLARLERARPERMRVTPTLALASLGWCGALIAVAFSRRGSWS